LKEYKFVASMAPQPGGYSSLVLEGSPYVQQRVIRDRAWAISLAVLYAGCLIFSVHAWKNM
jgi:hypothetical protein